MTRNMLFILAIGLAYFSASGQDDAAYVKANAVRIENIDKLNDAVYNLLNPFQIIMFGEMHGTNESAPFVNGLTNLFTGKGDSVQVGLEIPSSLMAQFISLRTESSIYQSDFFSMKPNSGKETTAWATLISNLNQNQGVQLFFFDVNDGDGKIYQRDSLMSAKIKAQIKQHPTWKMITLSGNYHNKISGNPSMTSFLLQDKHLKLCSLNMEYLNGSALANFGHGLEVKQLGSYPSAYNSTLDWDKFLLLVSDKSNYEYNGFYFMRSITPATLTRHY